ncbi:hypothetical protein CMI46_00730 [Candidatus Pacearchaeota archaeon]|nr:hypothetical protein [Candidatus Pacearchaeota archaeon]|tara:strand:+ start:1122 stop:1553 length:432 start_codon:yes stop_codon:yes gene_type:complete
MEKSHKVYFGLMLFMVVLVVHIEITLGKNYAPESVLVQIMDDNDMPEVGAECFADIESSQVNVEKKSLEALDDLYDFLDPGLFYSNIESEGYHFLETGFSEYSGRFEIKIVCYSAGFSGVSYTIINETSGNCEFKEDGKLLVC